jgi:catechol 2,3-dioxygenase-like lactoylglutathione lyase family enzyme
MVARMRHIALSVPDPEAAAVFFEQAFGMQRAGKAGIGLYACCHAAPILSTGWPTPTS